MGWLPISAYVSEMSQLYSERVAVEWGERFITYGELDAFARRICQALTEREGWKRESVVAIVSDSPFQLIASILGTITARGVFAPLDTMAPAKRLSFMIEEISPLCVLSGLAQVPEAALLSRGASSKIRLTDLERIGAESAKPAAPDYRSLDPDAICYLYFTSGSTGKPKAIAGRLKGIDHFVRWEIKSLEVNESSRFSQLASPAFDAYLKDVFVPLCAGGTVCAPENRALVWQPEPFSTWIEEARLTHLQCVPSIFRSLLQAPLDQDRFPDLKYVVLAGEPLLPSDVDRWMSIFGERIRLVNLYGPSETTITKLCHMVSAEDRTAKIVPIGRAMDGAAALVLDDEMAPCDPGVVGEIWIRTPFRSHGYYRRKDLTDEVFITNPFTRDPNDVIYRTRDYGRLREDGAIEFLGRADGQVKVRGVRIELGEVEDVLRRCTAVLESAVVVRQNMTGQSLCACLVLHPGESLEAVRRHLAEWLPAYMLPTDFILLDALPKTLTGKVDRKALATLSIEKRTAEGNETEAPLTPLQHDVAEVWSSVLKVPRVRRSDDFFELGGHSLSIMQVISRLRNKLGVEMAIADIFVAPKLETFSQKVERALEGKEILDRSATLPRAESTQVSPVTNSQ